VGDCVNSANKFINADNLLQVLLTLLCHLKHTQAQEVGPATDKPSTIKLIWEIRIKRLHDLQ